MLIISHLRLMIVLLVSKKRSMLLHSLQNSPILLLESGHAVTLSGREYHVHCLKNGVFCYSSDEFIILKDEPILQDNGYTT